MNPVDIMFFSVYIHYSNRIISALPVTSLIICHGYSTASSIADVVNRVLGNQVFQAIDMPLDTGPEKNCRTSKNIYPEEPGPVRAADFGGYGLSGVFGGTSVGDFRH